MPGANAPSTGIEGVALLQGLRRFAFGQPTALPVLGWGGAALWQRLRAEDRILAVQAPRNADLLVLAGEIPASWQPELSALFETLALPRLVMWLQPPWPCAPISGLPAGIHIAPEAIPRIDWAGVIDQLLAPGNPANAPLLEDKPPAPWRGVGPHGQGGQGMMGGVPYGRPMAMTADDPDGLMLDDVPTYLGPHFPGLPSGLCLELRVQGDRIRECTAARNIFPPEETSRMNAPGPVSVAECETERLQNHLYWMADFLELAGLSALSARAYRLANQPEHGAIQRLIAQAQWSGLLRRRCQGLGVITQEEAVHAALPDPAAKASGVDQDERTVQPAYQDLDFEAQVETQGDTWARWRLRVRECQQSLALIERAADRRLTVEPIPPAKAPGAATLELLRHKLAGLEWSQAVLFVASLGLDMGAVQ